MFILFEDYTPVEQMHNLFPQFSFIRKTLHYNNNYVLGRIRERVRTYNHGNPIINLLYNIGYNLDTDLDTYQGMVSYSNYGKVYDGVFYGKGSKEIIIVDTNDWIYDRNTDWKTVSPLNVILSPLSDFDYLIPDDRKNWDFKTDNLSVFSLNLKKLLYVYWNWYNTFKNEYGLNTFYELYILPNTLYSQTDMILFNRLMNLYYGKPMSRPLINPHYPVRKINDVIDGQLYKILEAIYKSKYTYATMLKMFPAIYHNSMYSFLMMPDLPLTRQINWSYAASRASIFKFLIEVGGDRDLAFNRTVLVNARIEINLLSTEHILKPMLGHYPNIYYELKDNLDYIYHALDNN